ncbi:unconventional myosin-Vb [Acanthopagrus latus]|uniref:unconventional myosin-Vb n=1 Tax=Acanthopagrus latus TaxID=8177 RepID=UPI00187C4F4C|nr:unconventional myosin-Vb [Acanthopagrus latus]XP_036970209.1 unconventional myosin-Vb [Acanthopagrus latus]XP_036970210.1 unconventional myosin-Vb [Acanthopagrus latus]XP_036970211.1 unconventional myosin-Vb [Acanthopagrus latus]
MASLELYSKGASVWIPDPDAVWASALLLQDYSPGKKQLLLQLANGKEVQYPVGSPSDLPPLGNPDILEGENDLTALSFLHEPAVLHNLRVRFLDYNSIYTYCGIVLVAINPYDQLPIYGEEVIDAYSGQDMADMEPHIFSVAEEAYRTMTREEKNQSIIISGESGSGKTVSAKFTMRYFAVVGGAAQQTSVEERVLASNPIMESIGNAKTTRNDNSSRFGKYIEIGFGRKGDIIGANMRTYLLEKSRVVFQASAERNYHIFYQLCASRELPEMRSFKLDAPEHFRYTNQGGDMQIPGTDDLSDLERTRNAFTVLGVQPDQQMELFRILAAVLHLGNVNIQISGRSSDKGYIDPGDRSLAVFSKLLGVEGPQMAHWLCHRRLAVGGEMLIKPMSGQQAVGARDALAKHIYGQLFTWTVQRLNSALRSQRGKARSFIGVLDIYGFETFDRNSFEQFCINYANEKLQQQFNRHVFHLEQEEYVREELVWNRIEFSDNQQCINLIEAQLGLFDLLDEECRMPKGSDESWVRKLYDQHLTGKPHPHFRKPRMSNSAFIVLHFADTVQYECDGFLDKNRDTVFEELINILKASQSELVAELFQQQGNVSSVANGSVRSGKRATREHKLTVGFQFRQSLQMLMDTLNSTTPHYVRCIKPNDLKEPFLFDPRRTVQQLRACGVLETIRISAAGFPSRWTYEEFFSRYRLLLRGPQSLDQAQASCRQALPELIPDPDQFCFGKTKVFFRAGQVAFLERLRSEKLRVAAMIIQSRVRGWLARTRYTRICWATVTIQRYCRGALARRLALTLRYSKAALVIQKTYRMIVVRQLFLMIRQATITIQAFTRGTLERRRYRLLVAERAAVLLQARVRGWLARRAYRRVRAAVVFMQCCARRRAARRELLKLKTEARSVEKYRELNKGMEVKLMQLQLRADQGAREGAALRGTLQAEREAASAELQALKAVIQKLESQKHEKPQPCTVISEKEVEERRRAEEKAAQEILQLKQELQVLQREKDSFHKEKEELSARLLEGEKAQEECVTQAVSQASAALSAELDEERRKYQGLLREFTRLEQRYDNLREMSLLTEHAKGHRRTDSTRSLNFEPPSPTLMTPQSLTPLSLSPFPSAFPSPEEVRRVSVTSPVDGRVSVWSSETPMDQLMEKMEVAKDPAVKMKGEDLAHAYDAVRVANKFLESQLRRQQSQKEEEMEALRKQLSQAISGSSSAAQQQDLQELLEAREQECVRLRRELKELKNTVSLRRLLTQVLPSALSAETTPCPSRRKPAMVTGLFECRKRDENKLIKNLITDIRVDSALSLPPGLPASVFFLCVRQADCSGDQTHARSLCSAAVTALKAALKKHSNDVHMTALWLKNACVLHDLLTQHSPKQTIDSDELVPLTTDVSDLIRALSDLCIQAYQQLLSITENRLQNIIVPALLESEIIPGLSGSAVKLVTSRKRAGSDPRAVGGDAPTMASVLRELGALHTALSRQDLPPTQMEQAFHQLTYLISASALNSLLLRKDMCCWSRGMQIRYNVSLLEEWLRSRGLQAGGAVATLEPLIQAVQLLQAGKKTEGDAQALVQTCTALSGQQIVKILTLYTPHSDLDERVTVNFIRTVQGLLKGRSDGHPQHLLMDVRRVFPVTFPYSPPTVLHAEQLVIPDSLKISFLRRV